MIVIGLVFLFLIFAIAIFLLVYTFILKKDINKEEILYQLEEFKKSRALIGTLCIILAMILNFVIAPSINSALNQKIKILESVRDIKIGEKLTSQMFREIEVGAYGLSNQIVKTKEELKDKYAVTPILKGQYLFKNSMDEKIPYENEYLYTTLTGLNRAISFKVKELEKGLSNKILQGDIISIILVDTSKNIAENVIIPEELKYVEVLSTTNDTGIDIEAIDDKEKNDTIYKTITVLVTDEQSKIIAGASSNKEIYVELVYRPGKKKLVTYFLEKQKKILIEKYPDSVDKDMEDEIRKILQEDENIITKEYSITEMNDLLEQQIKNSGLNNINIETTNDEEVEEIFEEDIEETYEATEQSSINIELEELERIKNEYNLN